MKPSRCPLSSQRICSGRWINSSQVIGRMNLQRIFLPSQFRKLLPLSRVVGDGWVWYNNTSIIWSTIHTYTFAFTLLSTEWNRWIRMITIIIIRWNASRQWTNGIILALENIFNAFYLKIACSMIFVIILRFANKHRATDRSTNWQLSTLSLHRANVTRYFFVITVFSIILFHLRGRVFCCWCFCWANAAQCTANQTASHYKALHKINRVYEHFMEKKSYVMV